MKQHRLQLRAKQQYHPNFFNVLQYPARLLPKKARQVLNIHVVFLIICVTILLGVVLTISRITDDRRMLEHMLTAVRPITLESVNVLTQESSVTVYSHNTSLLATRCESHPVWKKDLLWKSGILNPKICRVPSNHSFSIEEQIFEVKQLALLKETLLGDSTDFIPCGVHCVYHMDSAYSHHHGHSIYGWLLRNDTTLGDSPNKTACWEPFNSRNSNSPCVAYFFDDWTGYVEYIEREGRKLPPYQKLSTDANSVDTKRISEKISKFQHDCPSRVEPIHQNITSQRGLFCHFRSFDGGNNLGIRRRFDVDTNGIELRRNPRPSEIIYLFDRSQLGIDFLSDGLSLMTETYEELNTTSCNEKGYPERLLLCVYHRQSIPRAKSVPGQFGTKVPIKGWHYRTLDHCFIPLENMEHSSVCGRSSFQYNRWLKHMSTRQQQGHFAAPKENFVNLEKCDRIPLTRGRYRWDNKTNELVFLPPLPTAGHPIEGVEYSEKSVCGPRILLIGAMKCGTNTIGTLLSSHPRFRLNRCPSRKHANCNSLHFLGSYYYVWENHGLSHEYNIDRQNFVANYARRLPVTEEYEFNNHRDGSTFVGRGTLTIDKSPSYLNTEIFPDIGERAKKLFPNAKIIVSLCNPVERMYSEFHHTMKEDKRLFQQFFHDHKVPAPSNFTELVNYMKFSAEICKIHRMFCEELRRNLLRTGVYHEGIKHWRNAFGANNVLILDMDESNYDKMEKMTAFMGAFLPKDEYPWHKLANISKSFANDNYSGRNSGFGKHPQAFQWLRGFFHRHNVALAEELDAGWPLLWNENPTEEFL